MTIITLSATPPSGNNIYPNASSGRMKSKRLKKWLKDAGTELMIQRPKKHRNRVRVQYTFGFATNRIRDVFNFVKPCEDLLTRHQIIPSDDTRFVRGGSVWLAEDVDEDFTGVRIEIQEVGMNKKWKPIKTPPEDGVAVLVYCPDAIDPKIVLANRLTFEGDPDGSQWWDVWGDQAASLDDDTPPTHWMELPQIPEVA